MEPAGWIALAGVAASLVGTVINAIHNKKTEDTAEESNNLAQEEFEYQKELNEMQMEREDTSMQRKTEDLIAAGFSPYDALGQGGAQTTALGTSNAQLQQPNFIGNGFENVANMMSQINSDTAKRDELKIEKEKADVQKLAEIEKVNRELEESKRRDEENMREQEKHIKELEQMETDKSKTEEEIKNLKQEVEDKKQAIEESKKRIEEVDSTIKKNNQQIANLKTEKYNMEQEWKKNDLVKREQELKNEILQRQNEFQKTNGSFDEQQWKKFEREMRFKYADLGERALNDIARDTQMYLSGKNKKIRKPISMIMSLTK